MCIRDRGCLAGILCFLMFLIQRPDIGQMPDVVGLPFLQDGIRVFKTGLMNRTDRPVAGFQYNIQRKGIFFQPLADIGGFRLGSCLLYTSTNQSVFGLAGADSTVAGRNVPIDGNEKPEYQVGHRAIGIAGAIADHDTLAAAGLHVDVIDTGKGHGQEL